MKTPQKQILDKTVFMVLGATLFILTFILIVFANGNGMFFSSKNSISDEQRLPAANITTSGTYREVFTYRGRERQALIHIPTEYTNETPVPLVLVLHGYGGDATSMEEITNFSTIADANGFIAVYPEGIEHSWNAYICCGNAQQQNIDDVGYMIHIIDNLSDRLSLDLQKIYITGYSNGGMLAYYVGAQFPKRIAAIAPVSATIGGYRSPNAPLIQPSKFSDPVSALIIHGSDDEVIPYEGGESPIEEISFTSIEESIQFWKDQNTCTGEGTRQISSDGLTEQHGFFCANGATITNYVIQNGGHRWFDDEPGLQELEQVQTMSEVIWKFFDQNPNPNPIEEELPDEE